MLELSEKIVTRNRVLFHRVANTLNYMDIKTVVVSCGTCFNELKTYNLEKIFPGCRVIDIHDYLREKGVTAAGEKNVRYIYHDPCHSPLKEGKPIDTVNALLQPSDESKVVLSERCCGESGTFAIARPDISNQVRFPKEKSLKAASEKLHTDGFHGKVRVVTTCPGCLQGMSRYEDNVGTESSFLVVEMMKSRYGQNWMEQTISKLKQNGIEKVLL